MFIHCELLILILGLTLDGRVHTGEIIGGHESVPHSRPYMVLVVLHMEDGLKKHCGGFLLNEDFVMTAAHCQAKLYTVLLGLHSYKKKDGIQSLPVKEAYPHEDFNPADVKNDIMLLKLSSKANLTQNVSYIALADENNVSLPKSCLVSGWGKTGKNTKYMSGVLMEVNVTLIDSEECAQNHLYCSDGETGPGKGDSGGPLVCDGKVYGVISASLQLQSDKYVFTKIPDYRSWIDSIMNEV